jgi:hypothetical protein
MKRPPVGTRGQRGGSGSAEAVALVDNDVEVLHAHESATAFRLWYAVPGSGPGSHYGVALNSSVEGCTQRAIMPSTVDRLAP